MSEPGAPTQGLASHIQPGLIIAGKYRLERVIGRGSMGTVYLAVHVTLGQRVAIKLISSEHSQSPEARKRFSVEAKAAAKLRSRHVVQVYDDGETAEGNPYIVLEYLEGETLEQRLDREHDLPLADAVRVISHVGRALARAHAQGIVHRDLKPANIFLVKSEEDDEDFIAKVLDFGIAKLDGSGEKGTTQAGTVLGTPLFMSPEQVRGASNVDHRADLYSLGMCLFHMLTHDYAFYSPNYSDILIAICTQPLPALRAKAPWVPEAVERWFQRACAKAPLDRFQSADEMTEALHAAAGGIPRSRQQSSPEGRIAPETLVGFAGPALATLQLAPGPFLPTQAAAHAVPEATVSNAFAPTDDSLVENEWLPRRLQVRPLLLGLGLGSLVVASLAIALALLGSKTEPTSSKTGRPPPSASAIAVSGASALPTLRPPNPKPLQAAPANAVSSVAGANAASEIAKAPNPQAAAPKKSLLRSAPAAHTSAPARSASPGPPGSDLGF